MNTRRPVYLNLFKIHLPVTGVVSFAQRISGILLFLAIPLSVYLFHLSTISVSGFQEMLKLFDCVLIKLLCTGLLWAIVHHLIAGIRFLLIDADIGIEKQTAIRTAWSVIVLELVTVLSLLCWVWS